MMIKKFTEGLVFGAGFSISFIVLWLIASYAITPIIASSFKQELDHKLAEQTSPKISGSQAKFESPAETGKSFHDLPIEEQIEKASVIALARYEKGDDGKMKAIIKEFLKKDAAVTLYYKVGDEYPSASYYPSANRGYGDGVVIFFTDSPASIKMSMTYSGDRITGLGDLPIELLRQKCGTPKSGQSQ